MEIHLSIAIEILPDSEQRQFEKQCIDIAREALNGRTINNPGCNPGNTATINSTQKGLTVTGQ